MFLLFFCFLFSRDSLVWSSAGCVFGGWMCEGCQCQCQCQCHLYKQASLLSTQPNERNHEKYQKVPKLPQVAAYICIGRSAFTFAFPFACTTAQPIYLSTFTFSLSLSLSLVLVFCLCLCLCCVFFYAVFPVCCACVSPYLFGRRYLHPQAQGQFPNRRPSVPILHRAEEQYSGSPIASADTGFVGRLGETVGRAGLQEPILAAPAYRIVFLR